MKKEKKEKSEKKEKKVKAKKGKTKKEKTGIKKKGLSKKKLIILLLVLLAIAAAAFVFLRGRGDDSGEEEPVTEEEVIKEDPVISAPTAYILDEGLEIMALPVGRSVVVKAHTPTVEELTALAEELAAAAKAEAEAAAAAKAEATVEQLGASLEDGEEESIEDDEAAEETPTEEEELVLPPAYTTYIYTGEGADVERLELYCDLLTADDFGFIPVDEEMVETKMPKFTEPTGSLHLVRAVSGKDYMEEVNLAEKGEEDHMEYVPLAEPKELEGQFLTSLRIEWDEEGLRITPAMIEGAIVIPPPPKPMTLVEAVDHMYSLSPEMLGLEGDSMEPYMVFPIDGSVMVDGMPAMRMYVYSKSEGGTNVFEGQYLLSNGGHRIFVVQSDGSLREIEQ